MSDRCDEPKYPSAIKKRVSGDWNCSNCNNLNFAFRSYCNRCLCSKGPMELDEFPCALYITPPALDIVDEVDEHTSVPSKLLFGDLPSVSPFLRDKTLAIPTEAKPITQRLLKFEKENDPPAKEASIVSEDKVYTADRKWLQTALIGVKRPLTERQGDWVCLNCKNLNFAFRKECNRCLQAKKEYIAM